MSQYVRVGNMVLDPGRVKAARMHAADPHPELQLLIRAPH